MKSLEHEHIIITPKNITLPLRSLVSIWLSTNGPVTNVPTHVAGSYTRKT